MLRSDNPSVGRRWAMLGASVIAAMSSTAAVSGVGLLIPALHHDGMPLATGATLAAAASLGLVIGMFPWGIALDRYGERGVLLISLLATVVGNIATITAAATHAPAPVLGAAIFLGSLGSGAANGASGRIVAGWFPPQRRGFAMGVRQTAQPLGIGLCALTMPVLAENYGVATGFTPALILTLLGLAGVVVVVVDPPRPSVAAGNRPDNPYRGDWYLIRVHAVSVLLVLGQTMLWTFMPTYLITTHHWHPFTAGVLIFCSQILGAGGRIGGGWWSDRWGSRMKPIRVIAVAGAILFAALAIAEWQGWTAAAIVVLMATTVVTVADNGLAFAGVAEFAGPFWSGRALAVQNTGQHLAGVISTPLFGRAITSLGFPEVFAICALAPLLAVGLVPRDPARPEPAPEDSSSPAPQRSQT